MVNGGRSDKAKKADMKKQFFIENRYLNSAFRHRNIFFVDYFKIKN